MLAAAALCAAALGCAAGARLLSAVDISLRRGQTVCRRGTQKPCYKIVYFHDASRRTSYEEAHLACRADGGHLVSIETAAEQRLIETFIRSLLASDGDFWIGLRRKKEEEDNSTECQSFYSWSDGSSSKFRGIFPCGIPWDVWNDFYCMGQRGMQNVACSKISGYCTVVKIRNWYVDEPSCGSEICVVMYHQPSAPPGVGGPYMFQWNDDRCNMKNNFICKYSLEKPTSAPVENSRRDVATEPWSPVLPEERRKKGGNVTAVGAKEPVQSLAYILIPSIPVLLLLVVITAISCFWLFVRRREERMAASPKEEDAWLSNPSPSLDIYRVINRQSEADLAGTRPATKHSSFRAQQHRELGRGSEGTAVTTPSRGCATVASTDSGFVTNDIYELCGDRVGRSKESTWVENEIYGY